ncbi:hypothetical protein EZV62_014323 [Acer yangbiense]|uniref:CRM domain-containing protein n=1 Tax=Acer yangbiense TaxID=1000413 RepID=A0A5C7HRY7_9ROSI|nr:hypothetical protein EZV62_014323 [Acer yangbiense]
MLAKLHKTLTLIKDPKSPIFSLSCYYLIHSCSEDIYDPPFTPKLHIPQKPKTPQNPPDPNSKPNQLPLKSDLPFDFKYSYSETNPAVEPIGYREPKRFSPFGPGRLDRKWTGTVALASKEPDPNWVEERNQILGDPLSEEEVAELVEPYRHSDCSRQINLGKGGVTHNMLDDIHNHWRRAEAVRIKCLGVPTLDMDNVCFHLEGRNYDPKNRTVIPLMLWKPHAPIYPKLVKKVTDGLTFEERKEMRNRGLMSPPVMKLTRNGVYVNVVERVREAFKTEEVDLVPCVPILFKDEQIILWRGKKDQELDSVMDPATSP